MDFYDTEKEGCLFLLEQEALPGLSRVSLTSDNRGQGWRVHSKFEMPVWLAMITKDAFQGEMQELWLDPEINGGVLKDVFQIEPGRAKHVIEEAYVQRRGAALKAVGFDDLTINALLEQGLVGVIEGRNKSIHERDATIVSLNATIESLNKWQQTLQKNIAFHESEIDGLESIVVKHNAPSDLDGWIKIILPLWFLAHIIFPVELEEPNQANLIMFLSVDLLICVKVILLGIKAKTGFLDKFMNFLFR